MRLILRLVCAKGRCGGSAGLGPTLRPGYQYRRSRRFAPGARTLRSLGTKPPRVVSLVPSASETLVALGARPVACTRFCEQAGIPTVGGTKDPDLAAIVGLAPDLVVMNDEENRLVDAQGLRKAGLAVHEMSPRTLAEVGPAVASLARVVGAPVPHAFDGAAWAAFMERDQRLRAPGSVDDSSPRAFIPVWRRPWMTLSGATYGSDLLAFLGVSNVFAEAAERYPRVTLEDAAARHPDLVLLPSEPYPFRLRHVAELESAIPGALPLLVDGQDLFWWGIRTPEAVGRVAEALSAAAGPA
ncbi:MAG: helical backbone metal receptor [Acidimicrobiia bacterium]